MEIRRVARHVLLMEIIIASEASITVTRGPGGPDKARTYWVTPSTNPARKQMLPDKRAADLRAVGPVHVCICGCTMFKTIVAFEDYKPSYYYLEGECLSCDAIVILPCEVDRPE